MGAKEAVEEQVAVGVQGEVTEWKVDEASSGNSKGQGRATCEQGCCLCADRGESCEQRLARKEGKATPCGRRGRWGEESHGQPVVAGTPPVTAHTFSSHLVPRRKTLVILFFTHV